MISENKSIRGKTDTLDSQSDKSAIFRISVLEYFVFLFLAVVISVIIYKLNDPSTLPIKYVQIEGEFLHLSTDTLQNLVENKVKGGFFNINVSAIRNILMNEPWVYDVSVHRLWPDTIRVLVVEQNAVVRWKKSGLLNKNGELFLPDINTFPADLPLLEGPEGSEKLLMSKYQQINSLIKKIDMQLIELKLNDRRAWTLLLENDLHVIIGRSDILQLTEKFINYVPFGLKEKLAQARQIDMRYTNGFAVKWKQSNPGKDQTNVEQGA